MRIHLEGHETIFKPSLNAQMKNFGRNSSKQSNKNRAKMCML